MGQVWGEGGWRPDWRARNDDATAYRVSCVIHSCAPVGLAQGLAQSNCSLNLDELICTHVQFLPEIYFFFFLAFPTNEM